MRERIPELIRFTVAGFVSFFAELSTFILLKKYCGMDTLVSVPVAFVLAVVINYLMCALWVFRGAAHQSRKNQAAFFLTSAVGLALNEVLMLLFRVAWGEEQVLFSVFSFSVSLYALNKCIATGIVMIWNYFTKRKILTKNHESGEQKLW